MKWLRNLAIWSLFAVFTAGFATGAAAEPDADTSGDDVVDHSSFGELLEEYVDDDGQIDYARWHGSDEARQALSSYLDEVGSTSARGESRDAVLAYLINAYNALVIDDVLDRWPVENVTEEEGFFDKKRHRVARGTMTLDELDKEYIRERFGEPRINFVLVCAAKSCPPLRSEPLTADNLEKSLAEATRAYIPKVTEQVGENRVRTSKLFEWYTEEFEEDAGSLATYLAHYVTDDELKKLLESDDIDIVFDDYDWTINQS